MLDTKALLSLLGLPKSDKKLIGFMSKNQIQVDQELFLGSDEYRAYIERPLLGFCLIFTDESYFLGVGDMVIGEGNLYFSGVFFILKEKTITTSTKAICPLGCHLTIPGKMY